MPRGFYTRSVLKRALIKAQNSKFLSHTPPLASQTLSPFHQPFSVQLILFLFFRCLVERLLYEVGQDLLIIFFLMYGYFHLPFLPHRTLYISSIIKCRNYPLVYNHTGRLNIFPSHKGPQARTHRASHVFSPTSLSGIYYQSQKQVNHKQAK